MRGAAPRLGFLGLGWIGCNRLQAAVESGEVEIGGLSDVSSAALDRAARIAPGAPVIAAETALLEEPLDGLVIATPSAQHARQALAALERGIAVFCQKPLGRDVRETQRVVEAARAADRLLAVDLCYRTTTAMDKLRELVRAGELGDVYAIDLVFHNAYGPDKPWFYERAQSGGGALIDLGTHLVDLALWMLDFPEVTAVTGKLFARGKPIAPDAEQVEDHVLATVDLANGAVVRLACSWNLHAGRDCVIEARFHGTRAGGRFYNIDGSFYDFGAELFSRTSRRPLAEPPDAWGGRALLRWARRLARDRGFDPEALQLIQSAQVLDRIYGRSAMEAR